MLYPKVTERSRPSDTRRRRPRPTPPRVALVTGDSRALGRAIARRLARDGLAVAVNDLGDADQALTVVGEIRRDGGIAEAFSGDVSDARQAAALATAVAGSLGPIDVLVLNATGVQAEAPLGEVAWELRRVLLPAMKANGSGRIVKVDPELLDPPPNDLTRSWAWELARLGITVNTVAPRFVAPHRDVAHAVSFVASEDAGHITGQRIVIDGGRGPAG
jgi:3-oxoacyl-[acyl-carrier protein] reductase